MCPCIAWDFSASSWHTGCCSTPQENLVWHVFQHEFCKLLLKGLVHGIQNISSSVLTQRKGEKQVLQCLSCYLRHILHLFRVSSQTEGSPPGPGWTIHSHQAETPGKAPQTKNLGLMVQASMPVGTTVHGICGHPLLTGLGQGWRELPCPLPFTRACAFLLFLSSPSRLGRVRETSVGLSGWLQFPCTSYFHF